MKFVVQMFILLIISVLIISCQTTDHYSDEAFQQVDSLFQDFNKNTPGCAIAIIKDDDIIFKKGYGMADLEHEIPISPRSKFYIGSVSKQFVTFSILLLYEQGKLKLDDDVRMYIPEFPDYGYKLTIRHFIHHTSGVRDNLTLWTLTGNSILDEIPEEGIFELICRQKELNFEPGSQYLYSNSCYFMLGIIIERISGQTLNEFAQENIFRPLGMNNTLFHDDNTNLISNRAFGYSYAEGKVRNMISRFDLVGSGGIYSNVVDLAKWDRNFYKNNLGSRNQSLIDTMLTDGVLNSGESAGYAFALVNGEYRGQKTVSHSGALGGYRSFYLRLPDIRSSIIILGNFAEFNPGEKAYKVADIVFSNELAEETNQEIVSPAKESDEPEYNNIKDLTAYAGQYYSEELETRYTLTIDSSALYLTVGFNQPVRGKALSESRFEFNDLNIRFEKKNDLIEGFWLDAGRVKNLKFTRQD